jgi:hypothetical protein
VSKPRVISEEEFRLMVLRIEAEAKRDALKDAARMATGREPVRLPQLRVIRGGKARRTL